ncbi:MAG: hypothetical protein COU69_01800 [Candidatus Pacebacteria bacterium CG10_big_fil_rev_8_21_14_0_10_56_10]|nr:MAG: hypothetical protein COU69_01800 [Candidatus Pacebacteria bacterium CG10_big_fil_rev_8_21_14_0_10_56_10]
MFRTVSVVSIYLAVAALLAAQVVAVVMSGSITLGSNHQLAGLLSVKRELTGRKLGLQADIALATSLGQFNQASPSAEFVPISQPLSLSGQSSVAFR